MRTMVLILNTPYRQTLCGLVYRLNLTSQLPVSRWPEQIGDPTLADGILDRLVHDAHRIEMRRDSMRKNSLKANVQAWVNHRTQGRSHERGRPKNKTWPTVSSRSNPPKPSSVSLSGSKNSTLRDENSAANASGSGTWRSASQPGDALLTSRV
jgi:hypothetical protein